MVIGSRTFRTREIPTLHPGGRGHPGSDGIHPPILATVDPAAAARHEARGTRHAGIDDEQNWPVFSRGRYAQDSAVRTQVLDYRCPIEVGQVSIQPGDLVFGDLDGVVIIPRGVEAEVIAEALVKAIGENLVRQEIENGMSSTAAFAKYGIL